MLKVKKKLMRRVQDIRTLSGAGNHVSQPHRGYMRVACLELEKSRRGKERESATVRVQQIDARFREIESEQASILLALGRDKTSSGPVRPSCSPPSLPGNVFRLKY